MADVVVVFPLDQGAVACVEQERTEGHGRCEQRQMGERATREGRRGAGIGGWQERVERGGEGSQDNGACRSHGGPWIDHRLLWENEGCDSQDGCWGHDRPASAWPRVTGLHRFGTVGFQRVTAYKFKAIHVKIYSAQCS